MLKRRTRDVFQFQGRSRLPDVLTSPKSAEMPKQNASKGGEVSIADTVPRFRLSYFRFCIQLTRSSAFCLHVENLRALVVLAFLEVFML
jgi:hypothetical protein